MMLMAARNRQCNLFQRLFGVFLFAQMASATTFDVCARMGISVSRSTIEDYLALLGHSASDQIRELASKKRFLLIFDNINRTIRVWDAELGQRNVLQSGTAQIIVELHDNPDYEPKTFEIGLDPKVLEEARAKEVRRKLGLDILWERVSAGMDGTEEDWALHSLAVVADEAGPPLKHASEFVQARFAGPNAKRPQEARQTKFHVMETTDFNEADVSELPRLFEELLVNQCGMSKEDCEKFLSITGGDQNSAEKERVMKKFLADCPHGFERFGWLLPLIQLWHMGWADIERILKTHWGNKRDPSSFEVLNSWLRRKVKDVKRPDYYPALHLIFDTLRGDLLQCWRLILGTDDLKEYFRTADKPTITSDVLFEKAKVLVKRYLSAEAKDVALEGGPRAEAWFESSVPWSGKSDVPEPPEESTGRKKRKATSNQPFKGDLSLANRVQRMRDCMIHYSFQAAVADGDIGRVMEVLNIWVFTFAGSGKTKYTNELLELACNFEFEFTPQLKAIILDNWLVNITGWPGHWFPGDLLVEKHIKQLKKLAQRSDKTFGSFFFRRVVALNVRHLIDGTARLRAAVGLRPRTQLHRRKQQDTAMNELQRKFNEHKTHLFRPGRAYGFRAADNLAVGFNKLAADDEKRIRDFIDRTCREFGIGTFASHQPPSTDEENGEDEDDGAERFQDIQPNRMENGVLRLGDE
ncbi:hypothetical protein PENSPDRAFT_595952 [Peniophora sp. CONT]|nr:hypothetical protein PENSPDRAFT_595952 [Peniophora sp. CONT]